MYRIRQEVGKGLKNRYIVEKLKLSNCYVSLLLNRKKNCPYYMAFAIATIYGKEVEELFEEVGENE